MDRLGIIVRIALRSLTSHKVKNLIVGAILLLGTFLVILGTAVLDSVESAMQRSIVSSMAGHIQVYSSDGRDALALFGGGFMGAEDIGELRAFEDVRGAIEALPEVEAVVPMGLNVAAFTGGNEVDRLLTHLREAVKGGDDAEIAGMVGQLRQALELLAGETERRRTMTASPARIEAQLADLARVRSDAFWAELRTDPESALTFLDSRIAPIAPDDAMVYMRYLGTDLGKFARYFDRFEIVKGEAVPPGFRGLLINQKFYDDWIKNKVARELDQIDRALNLEGLTIATDAKLGSKVSRLEKLHRQITFELTPEATAKLEPRLRALLPGVEGDISALVQAFLRVDDASFDARYRFFYDEIAPLIELYRVPIGGTLTVRSFTKSGFMKSVNVKVWGTFRFRGLETSQLAGGTSLMDLITFRDLYGQVTAETLAETRAIQAEVGLEDVGREDAEAALFGGGGDAALVVEGDTEGFDEFEGVDLATRVERRRAVETKAFTQEQLERGLALNAAVILKDPSRIGPAMEKIRALSAERDLHLKVVDWQESSGIVGQFIVLVRGVLYVLIGVIFLVALVIINNSMIMATMERVTEIGTMRAIGAQRSWVLGLFFLETLVLGLISGTLGAGVAASALVYLGEVGIPAGNEQLVFLFSGPRLHPSFGLDHLLLGVVVILVVSLISTLYPARIATRIEPVVAMQASE